VKEENHYTDTQPGTKKKEEKKKKKRN